MKSEKLGHATSAAEVTNISKHGLWILVRDQEHFLPFEQFPWFADAPVSAVLRVEMPHEGHLFWPLLDVDLELDSIRKPDAFPLVAKTIS